VLEIVDLVKALQETMPVMATCSWVPETCIVPALARGAYGVTCFSEQSQVFWEACKTEMVIPIA